MNMKQNIIRLFMMAVFSAIFIGCSVDETGIEGSFPYLELDVTYMQLSKVAHTQSIDVRTNRTLTFKFSPYADWISAEYDKENGIINLTVTPNDLEMTRTVTMGITTSNSTVYKEIVLTQDASGELTHTGDLILRSKEEIADNTYTKVATGYDGTPGFLVLGNVTAATKAVNNSILVKLGDWTYNVSASDITDSDIETLAEKIHLIQGQGIIIANTNVNAIPQELIKANNVDKLAIDYNSLAVLPSATEISELNLKELSLKGNNLSDISSLAGNTTIEHLDISANNVHNIDALKSMPNLKTAVLTDLPLTQQQLEVYKESINFEVVAENLNSEDSPLPIFGNVEVVEVSDNEIHLSVPVLNNAQNLSKYGFYVGNKRNLNDMTFHSAEYSGGVLTLVYRPETILGKIFYVRAYAENVSGGNYSKVAHFGNVILEGNLEIKSDEDFAEFTDYPYSHINGSLLVGKISKYNSSGVLLDDGSFEYYFAPISFADMTPLRQVVYVRDGLYMGNVGVTNLDNVSHIQGLQTLWVKANNISYIPELESDKTLKNLDVSMNKLTDFNFLERMPDLERLYLGASQTASQETNDIGVLTGLEKYTNLKYIDLSGLPIHEWQVEDLRLLMPETNIHFVSAGRTPHLPTVKVGRLTRTETSVTLSGQLVSNGKSAVIEYGFYYGKDLNSLEKVPVGTSLGVGDTFSYVVELPDMDMYYFYPYAINSQGESRCEAEEFSLSYMNLSTGETANCYHIATPGRYKFDARVRGNSVESVGNPKSAEVLWAFSDPTYTSTVISSVELDEDGFVKFEITDDVIYGNALIAVKDAFGTILWSWHIWLCDFDPEETAQKYRSGAIMMDRNLGATLSEFYNDYEKKRAYGTQYQWGRKDPFVYVTVTETPSMANNAEEMYSRPTAYINDWTWNGNSEQLVTMWQPYIKTMHDPCPPGWKVATSDIWDGLSMSNATEYGVAFEYDGTSNRAYYPYSPRIEPGFVCSESTWESKIWTSNILDTWSPYCLSFYNYYSYSTDYCNNSYALSLRCMKDLGVEVEIIDITQHTKTVDVYASVTSKYGNAIEDKGITWRNSGHTNAEKISVGGGAGDFKLTIEGLSPETSYTIRTYAVVEGITMYGKETTFTTGKGGSGDNFTEDDYIWE